MIAKRDVALRLDVSIEMVTRHGLANGVTEAELVEIESNPPAWLIQSRANRKSGARPVWAELVCDVCGFKETVRPKKWWPTFTYLSCKTHAPSDLPAPLSGQYRSEFEGVGGRFIGVVDGSL